MAVLTADQLDPKQREAVEAALNPERRIVPITGGAGTGKTSLMRFVHEALLEAGYTVDVMAPTGKASKRISEATGVAARTIHRGLEYTHPGERDEKTGKTILDSYPRRDKQNPLEADVILADEYAMVNHEVNRNLINALKQGARLIPFGDVNQLPPIEKVAAIANMPTPFTDLLSRFNGITLDVIHRQGEGSGIVENGARIIKGFAPMRRPDFFIDANDAAIECLRTRVIDYPGSTAAEKANFAAVDHQVITPANISWVGAHAINAQLQGLLNPRVSMTGERSVFLPRHTWDVKHPINLYVDDKVIYGENLYDITADDGSEGLFNGEVGIVTAIGDFDEIEINFGDRTITLPPVMQRLHMKSGQMYQFDPRKALYLAYGLTTHKTQGSEYKHVIYVMNKSIWRMLNRHNFYTGVTRARYTVDVITDMRSMSTAISSVKAGFG